eukprot:CAMPEP_0181080368 /NCGR_PEP_ID=MMETSP1071-20121207/2529_1 /TAXON_ID=35127 /ORGANISM="Thalassiosira sp., Strain NH16" /LENGTH=561 /DNA_ID=CAMNT_0023161839 /DNA_START=80 /DNA_END=1761 /DNA_ORIENTATION=-
MSSDTAAVGTAAGLACGTAWLVYRAWFRKATCPNVTTSNDPVKQGFSMKKVPSNLDVIVIGSGMGGLTTAAILAKEGKRVLVLEQHDIAGGNLHTFEEKGYEFDTGLHYIGGKVGVKGSPLRKQFDYITEGQVEWDRMDEVYDVAISGSDRYNFCSGWRKLKKDLKASFPEEAVAIDRYFDMVHNTSDVLFPLFMILKMLPERVFKVCNWLLARHLGIFKKTTKEVMESITSNRKLIGVLTYIYGDCGEVPERGAFAMHSLLVSHYRTGSYYPIGGPLKISKSIVEVIEKWGGKVLVRAPVSSILIDNKNRAYGVVVKGKQILAKAIVSSVGAPTTYTKLIPESHRSSVNKYIDIMKDPSVQSNISLMSMFVGVDDPEGSLKLPKANYWIHQSWDHDKNLSEYKKNCLKLPAFFISFSSAKDPTYESRHPGKHSALVIGPCCYDDVEQYKDDRVKHRSDDYVSLKEKWKEIFMKVLLDQFPELENKIDYVDFGTAVSNDFYLGTHRGAVYGLAHTPKRFEQHWLRPRTPIKNLFLSGQDVTCCGVTGALIGGYLCAYTISA